MVLQRCPSCGSDKVKKMRYLGAECMVCPSCGYNECEQYDVIAEPRTSQKAKGKFSPYKTGGARRSVKK